MLTPESTASEWTPVTYGVSTWQAAQPMLVKTGKGVRTLEGGQMPEGIPVYENLADAVRAILAEAA